MISLNDNFANHLLLLQIVSLKVCDYPHLASVYQPRTEQIMAIKVLITLIEVLPQNNKYIQQCLERRSSQVLKQHELILTSSRKVINHANKLIIVLMTTLTNTINQSDN